MEGWRHGNGNGIDGVYAIIFDSWGMIASEVDKFQRKVIKDLIVSLSKN
jgi:hypothetical protein